MADASKIAAYYDNNTRHFLRLGGSADTAAIHRAIWAPGVRDRAAAFNYLNQLVGQAIAPVLPDQAAQSQARVLDIGCGVGGSATWLASTLGVDVIGVTLSAVQQQLASERADSLGLAQRCRFMQADFLQTNFAELPDRQPALAPVHAAFAIESFAHARDIDEFFATAARLIMPGGRLIICDDFLVSGLSDARAEFWVDRFRQGWHLNNLSSVGRTCAVAQQHCFRLLESVDLSPYIRSFHPAILLPLSHLTRLPLPFSYWQNLAGGSALQRCLKQGWTRYQALIWQRQI